ncbi:MAG: DUF2087 domain-containing protein [Caldimonas sp.]
MDLPPRLAALVVKTGLSPGLLGAADRDAVLALAASVFAAGREYREAEVNDALSAWLDGPGAMLRTDHVELRRWLVDAGFIGRDGFGRAYVRDAAEEDRADAVLGARSPGELDAAIAEARAADLARREARRSAHAGAAALSPARR